MDFEPHNFPALVASVIRSNPTLAEPLKEIFAAYARNDDLDDRWERIEVKFHQSVRLIMEDLNQIDDPISLDQEIQVLLQAIDQTLVQLVEENAFEEPVTIQKPRRLPAKKKAKASSKKKSGKTLVKKAGSKSSAKKKPSAKGKKKSAAKKIKKKR